MNEDKINPAVNTKIDIPPDMSAEEFQRRLYAWFEDRGLLSDLRAHLRTQMISVLKDTAVGRIVSTSTISPKVQALNLLIAEFLLQQDYHYSLSVFSAEVPLSNVLPEFPTSNFANQRTVKKWQFSDKDMWDILETLGIQRYTDEADNIFNAYYNGTNNDALLTCIVRMLNSLQSKPSKINMDAYPLDRVSVGWRKDIFEVLNAQNINTQNVHKILRVLDEIIEAEQSRLRNESREEYLKLEHELQLHYKTLVKAYEEKIVELQSALDFELTKKSEIAKDIERQRVQHRERLHKLVLREQNVSKRESHIDEKGAFIKAQEFLIKTKLDSLQIEQRSLNALQNKIEIEVRQKKSVKNDVKFVKVLENESRDVKEIISEVQEDEEETATNILITQLKNENGNLKTMNANQQLHIRELSRRATLLVHELEDAQNAVNSLQAHGHGIIMVPPLTPPNHYSGRPVSGGGGEEVGVRHSQRGLRQSTLVANTLESTRRRLPPRKLTIPSSSSSEDLSPTNELLKDARERLKRLEQESEEIDRNYKLYRNTLNNHFQLYSSAATAHGLMLPSTSFCGPFNSADLLNLTLDNEQINEENTEPKDQKQSDVSSDAWDGAGTSGISFSAAPTSDDKSDDDNAP